MKIEKAERESKQRAKRIVEALLFVSNEPVSLHKLREIIETAFPIGHKKFTGCYFGSSRRNTFSNNGALDYSRWGEGFLIKTCEEYGAFIDQLFRNKRTEKLSQAAAEVLAIVSYKQPITKSEIESIRGVDCSGILHALLDRALVEPVGRQEAPGRPTLYGITPRFLAHFGLKSISELHHVRSLRKNVYAEVLSF